MGFTKGSPSLPRDQDGPSPWAESEEAGGGPGLLPLWSLYVGFAPRVFPKMKNNHLVFPSPQKSFSI